VCIIFCRLGLKYPPIIRHAGVSVERAQPDGPARGIAGNYPTTGVSYVFPLPYPVPYDRHGIFLSFADHVVLVEEPPGGKIVLNGEAGHSASR
jgi:hypothetical protein